MDTTIISIISKEIITAKFRSSKKLDKFDVQIASKYKLV